MDRYDDNRDPRYDREPRYYRQNDGLSFLALIVAVGALLLAWIVYNNQIEEAREAVRHETRVLDQQMEEAADETEDAARAGAGTAVEKTGEALEAAGEAAQRAGEDIKSDNENQRR